MNYKEVKIGDTVRYYGGVCYHGIYEYDEVEVVTKRNIFEAILYADHLELITKGEKSHK